MAPSPDRSAAAPPAREVYSVTRVNREVRALLERGLPVLWVEGELTNFSQPSSGHWYFTLKDREAQLRCAMFRMRNALVGFTPSAGAQVLVRGRVSVYEARGEYQLIVEHLEEAGVGALRREFERLKAKLAAEGLFALERKREQTLGRELGLEPLELASQRTDTGLLQMLDDELVLTARLVHADAAAHQDLSAGARCEAHERVPHPEHGAAQLRFPVLEREVPVPG